MATITISLVDGVLSLDDGGHTNASKSEVIIWHPGTGVNSVTAVTVKSTSTKTTADFWSEPPAANGVNYKGKISSTASGDWIYKITTDVGSIDPIIQVR